ncbi:MAG: hypothetical protein K8R23_08975 [Chthoniobacter sp.]|nr:hypothetical protein [Chthoniobacter sp.]
MKPNILRGVLPGVLLSTAALFPMPARAQEADQAADLAKQLSNPVASLISVPFQANYDAGAGPTNDGWKFTLNVQPVVPISIGKDWNVIVRTIVPIIAQKDLFYREVPEFPGLPDDVLNRVPPALRGEAEKLGRRLYNEAVKKNPQNRYQSGFGDTVMSYFLSPKAPTSGGIIWGLGPVFLFPTATHPFLGGEKWGAGPTLVALKQSGGWTTGLLANHLWSFAGDDDRNNISATFLQPFVSYTTKTHTTFGLNTEATYDWNNSQWTVPLNLTVGQILKIGSQPVSITVGGRYYAEGPSGAPEWGA